MFIRAGLILVAALRFGVRGVCVAKSIGYQHRDRREDSKIFLENCSEDPNRIAKKHVYRDKFPSEPSCKRQENGGAGRNTPRLLGANGLNKDLRLPIEVDGQTGSVNQMGVPSELRPDMSVTDLAFTILKNFGKPMHFKQLISEVMRVKAISQENPGRLIAQMHTEINLDSRFIHQGNGEWGLREWQPKSSKVVKIRPESTGSTGKSSRKKAKADADEDDFGYEGEEEEEELAEETEEEYPLEEDEYEDDQPDEDEDDDR